MRVLSRVLVFFMVATCIGQMSVRSIYAADYTAPTNSREPQAREKVLGNRRDYTAQKTVDTQTQRQPQSTTEPVPNADSNVCTEDDMAKLKGYDDILAAYYTDSKDITANYGNYETTKQFEDAQKRLARSMDFIASPHFEEAKAIRKRCHSPAPPAPIDWPDWMPLPNPFTGEAANNQP